MFDTRGKLIALLKEADRAAYQALKDREDYEEKMVFDFFADHLIANGVTVQEWISVKDRLPEPFEEVLVYDHTGKSINCAYMTRHHEWVGAIMSHVVTHWMPLTQPPKGE